jgi:hypothetical protein
MATLTAVAAGGNWSSASTWSPAQVPTAADNCKITGTMTGTVTIDGTSGSPNLCRSLDCTGATHTLSHNGVLNIGDGSGGLLKLVAGMTYNVGSSSVINFVSTTTGNNITSAGKTMPNVEFNGAGGSWTLQDNLTFDTGSHAGITLTAGTLNAGAKTISNLYYFFSNNSNTRALTMSGSWTAEQWDITNSSGMTLTATGSTITFPVQVYFQGGGLTYGTVNFGTNTASIIYGANTFANLTYTGGSNLNDSITFGASQTVTGTLTIHGNSTINRILIQSDTLGTPRTLTTATNSITNADLKDITGAGASGWNLSSITGGSGNCEGCSGITFTTAINCYMVTATSVNWSASNWYTTSGGATHARIPLPQDTAIFDANSVTAGSVYIQADMPRLSAINATGVLNSPNLAATVNVTFYRDVILTSGMGTGPSSVAVTFENRGSIDLDSPIAWSLGDITQNGPGGTINLVNDFSTIDSVSVNINITAGTWNNGTYNMDVQTLTIDGGIFNLGSGLLTCAYNTSGGINLSAGTFEMNGNSVAFYALGSMNISGGVLNLSGQIGGSGGNWVETLTVSGGIINDTGSAGEIIAAYATFTGGTSTIRKLTLAETFSQSSTSFVEITGSATWGGDWTMSGTDFTFKTAGVPIWSAGTLTIYGGDSWTFGG